MALSNQKGKSPVHGEFVSLLSLESTRGPAPAMAPFGGGAVVFKRGRPPGKMLQLSGPEPTKAPSPPWEKNPEWLARRLVAVPSLCPPRPNGASPGTRQAAQPAGEATSERRQLGSPGRWGPEETRREPVPRLEPDRVSSHVRSPAPSLRGWGEPHRAWGGTFRFWGSPRVAPSRCQGALPRSWRPPWPDGAFCQELTPPFAVALQPMLTDAAEVLPQDSRPQKVGEPLGAAVPGRGGRSVSLGRDCLRRVGWWGHLAEPHWPLRPGQGPAPAGGLQTHQTK